MDDIKFDEFYNKIYNNSELIDKLESNRLKLFWQYKIQMILYFIIPPLILFLLSIQLNLKGKILFCLYFPIIFVLIFFLYKYFRQVYENKFKRYIKYHIIKFLINNISELKWFQRSNKAEYKPVSLIPDEDIINSELYRLFNIRFIDDEYNGMYKGISFNISETKFYYNTGRGYYSSYVWGWIFKGVIIKFDINKVIKNKTIILSKNEIPLQRIFNITSIMGFILLFIPVFYILINEIFVKNRTVIELLPVYYLIIVALILMLCVIISVFLDFKKEEQRNKKKNKVALENSKFMKKFDVYSSDQIEARYLISPAFMERFYNFKTIFNAKKIKCSFYDSSLMIAISTNKNLFEIGSLFKSIKDKDCIKQFFMELEIIYNMIDYFKLDEKTGL